MGRAAACCLCPGRSKYADDLTVVPTFLTQVFSGLSDQLSWVITRVDPCQHPQYTRAHNGGKAVGGSTALSTPQFLQHGSGAAVLVVVKQEPSASVCNSVCACGYATSENKPTFETHCEANANSPFHQCRNVDDCRMHTCGPRGTRVDGVNSHSCDCDPGSQEKDIDGDKVCEKNIDDCGACSIVRATETRCV